MRRTINVLWISLLFFATHTGYLDKWHCAQPNKLTRSTVAFLVLEFFLVFMNGFKWYKLESVKSDTIKNRDTSRYDSRTAWIDPVRLSLSCSLTCTYILNEWVLREFVQLCTRLGSTKICERIARKGLHVLRKRHGARHELWWDL